MELFKGNRKLRYLLAGMSVVIVAGATLTAMCGLAGCKSKEDTLASGTDVRYKCSKCDYEWDMTAEEEKDAAGGVMLMGREVLLDCPKCEAKASAAKMLKCPACDEFIVRERRERGDTTPLICPECGADLKKAFRDRARR